MPLTQEQINKYRKEVGLSVTAGVDSSVNKSTPTHTSIEELREEANRARTSNRRSTRQQSFGENFSEGFVKAGLKTARGVAQGAQALGQGVMGVISNPLNPAEGIKNIRNSDFGFSSLDNRTAEGQAVNEVLEIEDGAEQVGGAVSELAQFLLPTNAVVKGQKAVRGLVKGTGRLAKFLRGAGKVGVEGATDATVSAAQEGDFDEESRSEILTDAMFGTLFSSAGSLLQGSKAGLGEVGQKIENTIIRPNTRDIEDGFDLENIQKYQLGGDLQSVIAKTNSEINKRVQKLRGMLKGSDAVVNLGQVYDDTARRLLDSKSANFGDNAAVQRVLEQLDEEITEVAGRNGLVDLTEATTIKRGAGTKGAWAYNRPEPDANAIERVYNTFYNELKTAIEKNGPEGIKEVNKEIGELIPISNAALRRLPVEMRNNVLSLSDQIGLFSAVFDPRVLGVVGAQKLLKSGRFANFLMESARRAEQTTGESVAPLLRRFLGI